MRGPGHVGPFRGSAMRLLARRCAPLAVLCTGLGFVAVAVAPAASADTVTQYFGYTGGQQSFTVPGDVTSVHVVAVGGRGGDATRYGGGTDAGGSGAVVSADLQVTAGHTLSIEVGGNGETDQTDTAAGGFNGGATGGAGAVGAGGGGGASDVRTAPRADSGSLATRVLVAGGGGGAADGGGGGSSGVNGATSGSSGGD